MLVAAVLFNDSFLYYSFRCSYRELFCSRFRKLKFIGLKSSAGFALYSKRSHCTFASQYLASQHLYRFELNDVGSTSN